MVQRKRIASSKPSGARERARIIAIVERLPEGKAIPIGEHLRFEVRKRLFGWFMVDHHGDGRAQLNCKASADMHDVLQQLAPKHFHIPAYVGNKGWIGLWLDVPGIDWATVEMAVRHGYLRVAPKTLAAAVSADR
jgi:predicted DNA-binding protein (MmcQ/YjbR family)